MSLATPPISGTPSVYPKVLEIIGYYDPEEAERLKKAVDTLRSTPELIKLLIRKGIRDEEIYSVGTLVLVSRYVKLGKRPVILEEKLINDYKRVTGDTYVPQYYPSGKPDLRYAAITVYEGTVVRKMLIRMVYEAGLSKTLDDAERIVGRIVHGGLDVLDKPEDYARKVIETVREHVMRRYKIKDNEISVKITDGEIKVILPWDTITYKPREITPWIIADKVVELMEEKGYIVIDGRPAIKKNDKIILLPEGKELPRYQKIDLVLEHGGKTYHIESSGLRNELVVITMKIRESFYRYVSVNRWDPDVWRHLVFQMASKSFPKKDARRILSVLVERGIIPRDELPGLEQDLEVAYKSGISLLPARIENIPENDRGMLKECQYIGLIVPRRSPIGDYVANKYGNVKTDDYYVYVETPVRERFVLTRSEYIVVKHGDKKVALDPRYYRLITSVKPDRILVDYGYTIPIQIGDEQIYPATLYYFEKNGRLYEV